MAKSDVYGKYSLGSGAVLANVEKVWSDLADPDVLAGYETSMRRDLVKSGISLDKLENWNILDVGTGRQALTFLNLGARHVSHFDISPQNVERVNAYCDASNLRDQLDSTCCDLVETDLGTDRFDFVYLNGIVQHFSDVGKGLANAIRALKTGGYLWLYFYRSGTWDNFLLYMMRDLAYDSNVVTDDALMREYFVSTLLFYSEDVRKNYMSSIFMDGVFTRHARLYTPKTYFDFCQQAGLEVVSSSGLDPLGRDYDHYYARAATVVTLRKVRGDADLESARALLAPEREVDQLVSSIYEDPAIHRSIELYRKVKAQLTQPSVPPSVKVNAVARLFHFMTKARAPGYDVMNRHGDLHDLLTTLSDVLAQEYPATEK